jgi:hypothetical protein
MSRPVRLPSLRGHIRHESSTANRTSVYSTRGQQESDMDTTWSNKALQGTAAPLGSRMLQEILPATDCRRPS